MINKEHAHGGLNLDRDTELRKWNDLFKKFLDGG